MKRRRSEASFVHIEKEELKKHKKEILKEKFAFTIKQKHTDFLFPHQYNFRRIPPWRKEEVAEIEIEEYNLPEIPKSSQQENSAQYLDLFLKTPETEGIIEEEIPQEEKRIKEGDSDNETRKLREILFLICMKTKPKFHI